MRNAYTITGDTLRIFVSNFITLRPSSSLTRDSARALIGCTLQSVVLCSARPKLSQVRTMHLLSKHVTRENIVVDAPVKSRVQSSQWARRVGQWTRRDGLGTNILRVSLVTELKVSCYSVYI